MAPEATSTATPQVFLIGSSDREAAVRSLVEHAWQGGPSVGGGPSPAALSGKRVAVKANFNSADDFPASTHPDTLRALLTLLKEAGAREITLAERSGMGDTRRVLEILGIFALCEQLSVRVVVLNEEPEERWAHIPRGETHWLTGFYLARAVLEADVVVQTCCLKTHRFGGHFTMSLKNSVGLVAKKVPGGHYDYMYELHGSPFQRLMIAEVNRYYPVHLVVMDAAKAFVSGEGPEVEPGLMLAGTDRVAIDATGVALLRAYGCSSLGKKPLFELDQIRRAAELGVGVGAAEAVELVGLDDAGREAAERVRAVLGEG
jgi:uncharacterized protein (DUF362 family)